MSVTGPYSFQQQSGNAGLFNVSSDGLRQGTAFADASTRYRLRAGILSQSETIPMWGGVGIFANVPAGYGANSPHGPLTPLGTVVGRATGLTGSKKLIGFSVFDEAYAMVTTPFNPVPLCGSGGQVNYYPLGSLARIAVACDPSLVSLQGGTISNPGVAWDFTNQLLVPEIGTLTISSGTYNSTTGVVVLTMSATIGFGAGDSITTASMTASGGGAGNIGQLDGTWTAIPTTGGTTVTYQGPTGLGAITITGGSLTVGGTASQSLNVEVLDVKTSNCETVVWNGSLATWSYTGAAAVIALNSNG